MKKEVIRLEDKGGETFYSDFIVVSHNPTKFIIDFQQTIPKFQRTSNGAQQVMVVRHNTIILDPTVAKEFLNILSENIKRYEKNFGKIKVPKRKSKKKKKETKKKAEHATSYIG